MKSWKLILNLSVLLLFISANTARSQKTKILSLKDSLIEKSLITRNFVFTTNFVGEDYTGRPLLSPDFNLTVSSKKVVGELPSLSSYGSIAFTSFASVYKLNASNFYYKALAFDKKGYYVLIQPINDKVISSLIFNIDLKGKCNLTLIKNDKKTLKYNGYLAFNN